MLLHLHVTIGASAGAKHPWQPQTRDIQARGAMEERPDEIVGAPMPKRGETTAAATRGTTGPRLFVEHDVPCARPVGTSPSSAQEDAVVQVVLQQPR